MARAVTVNFATTERDRLMAASSRQNSQHAAHHERTGPEESPCPHWSHRSEGLVKKCELAWPLLSIPPDDERRVNVQFAAGCARHNAVGGGGNEELAATCHNCADRDAGDGLRHVAGPTGL